MHQLLLRTTYCFCLCFFSLFTAYAQPSGSADYSNAANWSALPWVKDLADIVPDSSLQNRQDSAPVDVFYIHPTTLMLSFAVKNAHLDHGRVNRRTDLTAMNQATVFNGSCRVYAPRYRQVSLYTFIKKPSEKREKAFEVAYQDVKAAFEYYLEHYNRGRPIILAGHSQGSYHGLRLLEEFFEGKPLYQKLVAAYLIGLPTGMPKDKYLRSLSDVKPCTSYNQIGCLITWNSYGYSQKTPFYFKNDLMFYGQGFEENKGKQFTATNPLTWLSNGQYAPHQLNLGSVKFTMSEDKFENAGILKGRVDARLENGVLRVHKPRASGLSLLLNKDLHVFDYNLFYMNIRKNVADRVAHYFQTRMAYLYPAIKKAAGRKTASGD